MLAYEKNSRRRKIQAPPPFSQQIYQIFEQWAGNGFAGLSQMRDADELIYHVMDWLMTAFNCAPPSTSAINDELWFLGRHFPEFGTWMIDKLKRNVFRRPVTPSPFASPTPQALLYRNDSPSLTPPRSYHSTPTVSTPTLHPLIPIQSYMPAHSRSRSPPCCRASPVYDKEHHPDVPYNSPALPRWPRTHHAQDFRPSLHPLHRNSPPNFTSYPPPHGPTAYRDKTRSEGSYPSRSRNVPYTRRCTSPRISSQRTPATASQSIWSIYGYDIETTFRKTLVLHREFEDLIATPCNYVGRIPRDESRVTQALTAWEEAQSLLAPHNQHNPASAHPYI
ncbi:hypothetical protein DFS34DRAFT_147988 [Phlyctochytrium arcticum]|nr:hypothetical protein DFS34DRAFT_147988 [Phlyctochytrium arcticum]